MGAPSAASPVTLMANPPSGAMMSVSTHPASGRSATPTATTARSATRLHPALATVCIFAALEDKLDAAASAGFDGVEIFEPDVVAAPFSAAQVRSRCADIGLSIDRGHPFRDYDGAHPEVLEANLHRTDHQHSGSASTASTSCPAARTRRGSKTSRRPAVLPATGRCRAHGHGRAAVEPALPAPPRQFHLPAFLGDVLAAGYTGPFTRGLQPVFRRSEPRRAAVEALRSLLALEESTLGRLPVTVLDRMAPSSTPGVLRGRAADRRLPRLRREQCARSDGRAPAAACGLPRARSE